STTYDLLHRHCWRKIMPRPRYPKADKDAQAKERRKRRFLEVI
ncbi:MAG: winged helix-turn-helix domain-containing protein, partial [Alphaproteobacteria bacterium]|nr:winged helix-turn-helix domain-containing protein [Alphaproteobacteria bacterium]